MEHQSIDHLDENDRSDDLSWDKAFLHKQRAQWLVNALLARFELFD